MSTYQAWRCFLPRVSCGSVCCWPYSREVPYVYDLGGLIKFLIQLITLLYLKQRRSNMKAAECLSSPFQSTLVAF